MTLAKPGNNFDLSTATQYRTILKNKLGPLATRTMDGTLGLWRRYQPITYEKLLAVWQLLRHTQPVQLLLSAALAILAIALVTLVNTFNGVIILGLKMTALTLATVAVGQWVVRGLNWANQKLPSDTHQ